jgi:integrase
MSQPAAKITEFPASPDKRERFPMEVKSGSVVVSVYKYSRKFKRRDGTSYTKDVYSVGYTTPSGDRREQFMRLASAKERARLVADQLAAGEPDGALMTKADRSELDAARELAGDAGVLTALKEWKEARELAGVELVAAARAWGRRQTSVKPLPVPEVVRLFREAKESEGVDLENSYNAVLNAFEAFFKTRTIDDIHARELTEWLKRQKEPATRNTYRKRVVTLFRWARDEEYLPRDMVTEAERTKATKEKAPSRSLLTPATMHRILDGIAKEHTYLPALVVSALAGLRSKEAHKQDWKDINLEEKYLNVTAAKEGTPADRYVPLSDAAVAWLSTIPKKDRVGRIHPYTTEVFTLIRRFIIEKLNIPLPKNCFRKSWISHRLAVRRDIAAVALEAGHTAQVEVRNYLGKVTEKQGPAWFAIFPDSPLAFPTLHNRDWAKRSSHAVMMKRASKFPPPERGRWISGEIMWKDRPRKPWIVDHVDMVRVNAVASEIGASG